MITRILSAMVLIAGMVIGSVAIASPASAAMKCQDSRAIFGKKDVRAKTFEQGEYTVEASVINFYDHCPDSNEKVKNQLTRVCVTDVYPTSPGVGVVPDVDFSVRWSDGNVFDSKVVTKFASSAGNCQDAVTSGAWTRVDRGAWWGVETFDPLTSWGGSGWKNGYYKDYGWWFNPGSDGNITWHPLPCATTTCPTQ